MKEDNMVNETQQPVEQTVQETTPVAPAPEVAPVAPTPEVAPTPVAPIEPVATEPVQMEGPKKKKSILPALIVIIIILLLLGGAAYYLFVMNTNNPVYKMFIKEGSTTTTTTTTEGTTTTNVTPDKEPEMLSIKSLDDYVNLAKGKVSADNVRSFPILLDDSFYELNYDLKGKCKDDGGKVSFEIKKSKIEYTCKAEDICANEPNCSLDGPVWSAEITVNGKFKTKEMTYSACVTSKEYTNGKYYLGDSHSCGAGEESIVILDENNNKLLDTLYENVYIKKYNNDTDREEYPSPVLIKDNILYFVTADSTENDGYSTCRVKYVDFNKDKAEVKDLNVSGQCYHFVD